MTKEDYLTRHKMTNKVCAACKSKTEAVHSGKRTDKATFQKSASTIKYEVIQDVFSNIQYIVGGTCGSFLHLHFGVTPARSFSNIIKGLAAFDFFIMFKRPTEVSFRHFDILYSTLQRPSWVLSSNESARREQYIELLDYFRANSASDSCQTLP